MSHTWIHCYAVGVCRAHADKLCCFMRFSSLANTQAHTPTPAHIFVYTKTHPSAWQRQHQNKRTHERHRQCPTSFDVFGVDLTCLLLWPG